ncbi:unnamed protein product [Linum trigynum]|uniref:Uncharacterized protein n=1 Tax=Linum trigynum TaxID=586398 RepID=A0AAV2D2Q6_9ROSI
MAALQSRNYQNKLIPTIFLAILILSISVQQCPCNATRDVFHDEPAVTTAVKEQPASAADYQVEGKYPFCSWCCNILVGNLCCHDLKWFKCGRGI